MTTINDMHFTYACMMHVFGIMAQPREIKKTSHFSTMFVRVETYHGMHAVAHGHPEPIGGCHAPIGKTCARARTPHLPRKPSRTPTPPSKEAAPEKEEEAAEARHLLCVCV